MTKRTQQRASATQRAEPDPTPADRDGPPIDDEPIQVIDHRGGGWWRASNSLIDVYGPKIGAIGVAVYCVLARYSENGTQPCKPSIHKIAKHLDISDNTVKAKLDILGQGRPGAAGRPPVKGLRLIHVKRGRREIINGKIRNQPNVYILLPIPGSTIDLDQPLTQVDGSTIDPGVGQWLPTKNTNTKKTPPPTSETGKAEAQHGGGGDVAKADPEHTEAVMRELVKHGARRTQHAQRIAAKIAQHMPNLSVAAAVIAATAKDVAAPRSKNPPGAMLTGLDAMTADDWKAKTPKPAMTYRVIDPED